MTDQQPRFEVIAAFADGERVDTRALREALSHEEGRDYLIDLVAMREVVGSPEMTPRVVSSIENDLRGRFRDRGRYRKFLAAAAAAIIAVGAAGYAVGQQRSRVVTIAAHPPLEADAVLSVESAPAPTQVIRLGDAIPGGGR